MAPGAHNKDFMKKHFLTPYLLLKSSVVQTTSATRAFLILLEVVSGVRHHSRLRLQLTTHETLQLNTRITPIH